MKNNNLINVLIDVGNFDPKVGASNDVIDIIRYSDKNIKFFITGNYEEEAFSSICTPPPSHSKISVVERDKKQYFSYLKSILAWIFYLKKNKINTIHINYTGWITSLISAAKILRLNVVGRAGYKTLKSNPAIPLFDHFVGNSSAQAETLLNSIYRTKVSIVGDLVNIERLNKNTVPITTSEAVTNLLFIGQITHRKGVHVLVEALYRLQQSTCGKYVCTILGGDWSKADIYMKSIKQFVADKQLDNISLVEHTSDITPYLHKADILIVPSLSEARPRVILEAMCLEKFVIASNVGGIPSIIEDKISGVLVEPDNAQALCESIMNYMVNEHEMKRISQAAKRYFDENLDPRLTVQRYNAIYRNETSKLN